MRRLTAELLICSDNRQHGVSDPKPKRSRIEGGRVCVFTFPLNILVVKCISLPTDDMTHGVASCCLLKVTVWKQLIKSII